MVSAHFQRWQKDFVKRAAVQRANEVVPVPGRVAHNELTMLDHAGAANLGEWMTWAYSHPEKASDFPGDDSGSSAGKRWSRMEAVGSSDLGPEDDGSVDD